MKEVSQFIILGFLIGVFPILNRWRAFIDWIKKIVLSAGSHGGETFLLEKYFSYLYFLFQKDLLLYFFLIFVPFILFSLNKIWKKKRTIKLLISLFFSSFFCIFLFAKYHDSHYQIVNYLIISVLSSLVIVVIPSAFKKIVFLILIFLFSGVIISNFQEMVNSFDQANRTRDFIKRYNDNSQLTIWTYFSPSREYALIHGYIYSGFYGQELRKIYPNIINIDGYPKKVYDFDGKIYELKDFCWKNAFIPSFMLEEFLEQYQQYGVLDDLEIFSSPDKNLYFIQRAKCTDSEKRI